MKKNLIKKLSRMDQDSNIKTCDKCIHFDICSVQKSTSKILPDFVDFNTPNGAEWMDRLWKLFAERCRYHKKKINES